MVTEDLTRIDSLTSSASSVPQFSVIWYGLNRLSSARETLAALQAQTNMNFELVVEDCGSSDGTLEFFQEAATNDPRIRIYSRWATRTGEVLLRALRRCRGEFVAISPSEGHLRPEALEVAARELNLRPMLGAICTPEFLVDAHGGHLQPVDIVTLLLSSFRPFLPAAFIRRSALILSGLNEEDWSRDALDLEIGYRLCADHGVASVSRRLIECPNPRRQIDGLSYDIEAAIEDRMKLASKAFSPDGFFGGDHSNLALECKANQLSIIWGQVETLERADLSYKLTEPLAAVASELDARLKLDHRTLSNLHRLIGIRTRDLGLANAPLQKLLTRTKRMVGRLPVHIGYSIWNAPFLGAWLKRKAIRETLPESDFHSLSPGRSEMFAEVYGLAGSIYEARGQIDLAIEMWDRARPPDDIGIDSLACQAMLKSPAATDESLAARHLEWVRRHLGKRPLIALPRRASKGKIRIGYSCAFMDSDTIRNMMGNVLAAHDRVDFEIYGYSPRPIPSDILRGFDVWRRTPSPPNPGDADPVPGKFYSDDEFAQLVRADEIDIFVELTGYSPGHRFGAMSLRCAPVQISFLNHTGTSQVPNVDYVLCDDICIPNSSNAQQYYSEVIYRMPGCFFCFDYTMMNEPDVAHPPFLRNGHVTFGCFGTGSKIGIDLIEVWAKILHRVPGSALHLQNPQLSNPANRRFMAARFQQSGIASDRLILEGGVDRSTLLQVYRQIDISLDTWPYSGGNTIAESFWHGVPVVTCRGGRFSSAYGASLVTAAGCPDLVAGSLEEYVEIAANLASDEQRLLSLRRTLRHKSSDGGLADSWRFARALEGAYRDMLGRLDMVGHAEVATVTSAEAASP